MQAAVKQKTLTVPELTRQISLLKGQIDRESHSLRNQQELYEASLSSADAIVTKLKALSEKADPEKHESLVSLNRTCVHLSRIEDSKPMRDWID